MPNPFSLIIISIELAEIKKITILQHFLQIPYFYFNFQVWVFFLIAYVLWGAALEAL